MKRKNEMRKVREQAGRIVLEEGLSDSTKLNELAKRYQELRNEAEISGIERKIDKLYSNMGKIIGNAEIGEDDTLDESSEFRVNLLEENIKGLLDQINVIKNTPAPKLSLAEDEESWKEKYNRLEADYVHLKIQTDTLKEHIRKFMREEF